MKKGLKIPVIVERAVSFSISDLKRVGLFKKGETYLEMPMTIKKVDTSGESNHSLQIAVSRQEGNSYIRLSYSLDGEQVNYLIPLVRLKSNLGKGGWLWYCLCPVNKQRCRKLLLSGRYFIGIKSIKSSFYRKQIIAKNRRSEFNVMSKLNECERIIKGRAKKHFISHYAGSPTKRQLRVMKAKAELDQLNQAIYAQ